MLKLRKKVIFIALAIALLGVGLWTAYRMVENTGRTPSLGQDSQTLAEDAKDADTLMNAGLFAQALVKLQRIEPKFKDNADYHYDLGVVYYHLKDMVKSKESFKRALALDPDHARAKQALQKYLPNNL